ncbi:DNA-binding protein [Candidatus Bathyarchaeota archaeon]|nr:DNA-binding protein [Candidatus Bathyarchaeota archaeon]
MKYYSTEKIGRIFVLSLEPGDYVLESIKEVVKKEKIRDAVVVSAVGTLDLYRIHYVTTTGYPPQNKFEHWKDKPLELASINGIVANGEPHLHIVVSDSEKAYAGHLEEGCRTLYLAEITIIEIKGLNLKRQPNQKNIITLTGET